MTSTQHLQESLTLAREQLAAAKRRRPPLTSGGDFFARKAAQIERRQAAVERLERKLADAIEADLQRELQNGWV